MSAFNNTTVLFLNATISAIQEISEDDGEEIPVLFKHIPAPKRKPKTTPSPKPKLKCPKPSKPHVCPAPKGTLAKTPYTWNHCARDFVSRVFLLCSGKKYGQQNDALYFGTRTM